MEEKINNYKKFMSLIIYRFLVFILIYGSINPLVITTLKVSKALNNRPKVSAIFYKKVNKLPNTLKPYAKKIIRKIENIYIKQNYDWPKTDGISITSYYIKFAIANLIILSLLLIKKEKSLIFLNYLITVFNRKDKFTYKTRLSIVFLAFVIFTWILRLHWGFWWTGIWGWSYTYKQSLLPTKNEKLYFNSKKQNEIYNYSDCIINNPYIFNTAINKNKLPEFKGKFLNSNFYKIETKFFVGSNQQKDNSLYSDAAFGMIFAWVQLKDIGVNKDLQKFHLDIINKRLENYQKYNGPFLLPTKYAYPSHFRLNSESTNQLESISKLGLYKVEYLINLKEKNFYIDSIKLLTSYPKCK